MSRAASLFILWSTTGLMFACGQEGQGVSTEAGRTSVSRPVTREVRGRPGLDEVKSDPGAPIANATPTMTADQVIDAFHLLSYDSKDETWRNTYWMGVSVLKNVLDLWVYQEMIYELRPDLIIETGTASGGSALYLAHLCDMMDHGRVVTIDIEPADQMSVWNQSIEPGTAVRPPHPRIAYLEGSSTDPAIVARVKDSIAKGERVMVILDSDHRKEHVIEEMRIFGPMVTEGSYLVVEDTNINGHPVSKDCFPGPWEAVSEFLAESDEFEVDKVRQKYLYTHNPRGFLRRSHVQQGVHP